MIKISLLPPQQIQKIKSLIIYQYAFFSVLIIFLMLLVVLIVLASFLLFLNLKYASLEKNIDLEQVKVVQTESIKTLQIKVKDLNESMAKIKKIQDKRTNLYGVLETITGELLSNVKIYTLEINEKGLISVTGNASFREDLVAIRKILNTNPRYKEVDFPLSNLANPQNINFRFSFLYNL